jgi:hypothetical protein
MELNNNDFNLSLKKKQRKKTYQKGRKKKKNEFAFLN